MNVHCVLVPDIVIVIVYKGGQLHIYGVGKAAYINESLIRSSW